MTSITGKRERIWIDAEMIIDYLPDRFEVVIVHCKTFSCCAFLDAQGIWRNKYTYGPLEARVLGWVPFG